MTDSIPPSLLQGLPPLPPEQPDGDIVRIEDIAGELRTVARAIRIAGEVIRQNRDGTILIHTDKGDVTVRPRGDVDFKAGDQVEIDIPPGRPPRQAVVREAPPLPAPPPAVQDPPDPVAAPRLPPARPSPDLSHQEYAPPDKAPAPVPVSVRPGDIIRLLPLPPEAAAQIVQPEAILETAVVTPLPEKTQFIAALVVADIETDQIKELFSIAVKDAPVLAPEVTPRLPLTTLFTHEPVATAVKLPPSQKTIIEQILLPLLKLTAAAPDFLLPLEPGQKTALPLRTAPLFQFLKQAVMEAPVIRLLPPQAQANPADVVLRTTLPQASVPPDLQQAPLFPRTPIHNLPLILPASVLGKDIIAEFVIRGTSPLITTSAHSDIARPVISGDVTVPLPDMRIVSVLPPSVVLTVPGDKNTSVAANMMHLFPAPNPLFTTLVLPFQPQEQGRGNEQVVKTTSVPRIVLASSPLTITAPVIGMMPETHHSVLAVPVPGRPQPILFAMPFATPDLPPGTAVELAILPGSASPLAQPLAAAAAILPAPPWQIFTGFDWPAFDDMQQVLQQQIFVQMAQGQTAAPHAVIPAPASPAQVPAAALFFIAAVRAGDMAGWLGEKTIDALRRAGREDIIGRLGRDFSGLQRSDVDPVAQDWRAMSVPLSWQNEIHKMMIYYRRDERDQDKDGGKKKDARFIIEISPPRMGLVQLDGLHRAKKLDLIVRTQKVMGPAMKQALRRLWVKALEQTDLSGEISFQSKPEQFVKIEISAGQGILSA